MPMLTPRIRHLDNSVTMAPVRSEIHVMRPLSQRNHKPPIVCAFVCFDLERDKRAKSQEGSE